MSQFIYRFDEIAVTIDDDVQGLVQSVAVRADTGLDFVTFDRITSQGIYRKANNITIDIVKIHDGTFVSPTNCLLYDNTGNIIIQRNDGNNINFSGCILIGTKSEIKADSAFGTKTLTYMSLGYSNTTNSFTSPTPPTGNIEANRVCYTGILESGQIGFESSCTINREFLYNQGRASPTHLCIKYPIETTSTVTKVENSLSTIKGSGSIQECSEIPSASIYAGIDDGYLESVSIEGATVQGDYQIVAYNYRSTTDYGLQRIINLTGTN